jgi:heme exporter protein A
MSEIHLSAANISKRFQGIQPIFKNISVEITNGDVLGITGANGSGKSTFLKILSGTLLPSNGTVELQLNKNIIPAEQFHRHIGFVSPYLALYEEFTPLEHCAITSEMRGLSFKKEKADTLLEHFGLFKRRDSQIRAFSSGMKQRVKYILALLHEPEILFLDEPTTNFDAVGVLAVEQIISAFKNSGKSVVVATNDERELAWCTSSISVV